MSSSCFGDRFRGQGEHLHTPMSSTVPCLWLAMKVGCEDSVSVQAGTKQSLILNTCVDDCKVYLFAHLQSAVHFIHPIT